MWSITNYDPHRDVDPGCEFPGCGAASDGALDGTPYCLAHVELVIDRWAASVEYPEAARMLPAFSDL